MGRPRLTYANIVSTIALIAALGTGTAYATVAYNTVNSNHVVNNSLKSADIKNGSLKWRDLGPAQVFGYYHIAPRSINREAMRLDALASTEVTATYFFNGNEGTETRTVSCPVGMLAVDHYESVSAPLGGFNGQAVKIQGRHVVQELTASGNHPSSLTMEVDCVGF